MTPFPKKTKNYSSPEHCGIVLSGGDGRRLQSYIKKIRGDKTPKQYVKFFGYESLLESTFSRAEKLLKKTRLFTVITQNHLQYPNVKEQLFDREKETVVIQPENKGTGPGILLSTLLLENRYPESIVVIFPTDHFILEDEVFLDYVDQAFKMVEKNASKWILLGSEPFGPEPEYGYILPTKSSVREKISTAKKVWKFVEKPGIMEAQRLIECGALWNTFIMVFKTKTLLNFVSYINPNLFSLFLKIKKAMGTAREKEVLKEVYQCIGTLDFSRVFLEKIPFQNSISLFVLPMVGVFWSDLGSQDRLMKVLKERGFNGDLKEFHETKNDHRNKITL